MKEYSYDRKRFKITYSCCFHVIIGSVELAFQTCLLCVALVFRLILLSFASLSCLSQTICRLAYPSKAPLGQAPYLIFYEGVRLIVFLVAIDSIHKSQRVRPIQAYKMQLLTMKQLSLDTCLNRTMLHLSFKGTFATKLAF